jgi:hypothetical protein
MKQFVVFLMLSLVACSSPTNHAPQRDANGRIHRSETAKNAFKRSHPCPATGKDHGPCPGYVIDHVKPLACGGEDDPSNMQWQTTEEGKVKDKWELKVYCGK